MFKRKQKTIDDAVKNWLIKSQDPKKTYVIAVVHKKNKKLYNVVVELENEIVTIDKTPYYAGTDALFYRTESVNKKKLDIPMVDVYEGFCLSVHPSKDVQDIKFSKRVLDMVSLRIEQGILENRRKQKIDLKKIIIAVLIGGAAIFIISKMF